MATATKPKPVTSLPASIEALHAEMRAEGLARWRAWAKQIAEGGNPPSARDLLEVGAILEVDTPAERLQADADALAELATFERSAESCRRAVAEKLEPFGGRIERLRAKLAATKAEVEQLAATLQDVEHGCSEPHWTSAIHHLKRRHERLFPEMQPPRPVAENFIELELDR